MSQASVELLRELTQADAIPGHEEEVRHIFGSHLEGVGTIQKRSAGKHLLHQERKDGETAHPP